MELKKGPLTKHFLNVVLYVSSVAALRPAGFKEVVNTLQWNELWIFSFMFAAVIFENLLYNGKLGGTVTSSGHFCLACHMASPVFTPKFLAI